VKGYSVIEGISEAILERTGNGEVIIFVHDEKEEELLGWLRTLELPTSAFQSCKLCCGTAWS